MKAIGIDENVHKKKIKTAVAEETSVDNPFWNSLKTSWTVDCELENRILNVFDKWYQQYNDKLDR